MSTTPPSEPWGRPSEEAPDPPVQCRIRQFQPAAGLPSPAPGLPPPAAGPTRRPGPGTRRHRGVGLPSTPGLRVPATPQRLPVRARIRLPTTPQRLPVWARIRLPTAPTRRRLPTTPRLRLPATPQGGYQSGYPPPPPGAYPPPPGSSYPPPPSAWRQSDDRWSPDNGAGGILAGWWRRVAATIVDGILLGVVSGIILAVTGTSRGTGYFLEAVLQAVYLILMIGGHGGRTIGNMAASTVTIDGRTGAPLALRPGRSPRARADRPGLYHHRRHPRRALAALGPAEPDPA